MLRILDRENVKVQEQFKKICKDEGPETNLRAFKLSKNAFKQFLAKVSGGGVVTAQRYKGKISEKIINLFDFTMQYDFNDYCNALEAFMHSSDDVLKRVAFAMLDMNEDNYISEMDLYQLMYTLEGSVFVDVLDRDMIKLIEVLQNKKRQREKHDEVQNEMRKLESNLRTWEIEQRNPKRKKKSNGEFDIFSYTGIKMLAEYPRFFL